MNVNRKRAPSPTITAEAQRLYKLFLAAPDLKANNLLEDSWLAIGKYWDINLWVDEHNQRKATVYPVYNNDTDTSQPYPVTLPDESQINV